MISVRVCGTDATPTGNGGRVSGRLRSGPRWWGGLRRSIPDIRAGGRPAILQELFELGDLRIQRSETAECAQRGQFGSGIFGLAFCDQEADQIRMREGLAGRAL